VSEWLKEPVSKTGIPVRVSRVRIPPCPLSPFCRIHHGNTKHTEDSTDRFSRLSCCVDAVPPRDAGCPATPKKPLATIASIPDESRGSLDGDIRCLPCFGGEVPPKVLQELALTYPDVELAERLGAGQRLVERQ
jgi:hypothetical protein